MGGDGTSVHYKVLSNGKTAIKNLISAEGPNGVAMTDPTKAPTPATNYTFNHFWYDKDSKKYYYESRYFNSWSEANSAFSSRYGNKDLPTYLPNTYLTGSLEELTPIKNNAASAEDDYTFYYIPMFDADSRTYTVTFYDGATKVGTEYVPYDTVYNGSIRNYWYKDSSSFEDVAKRWSFQGWSTSNYGTGSVNNPSYIDLDTYVVRSPITLYAHYIEEDCRAVASKAEYFEVTPGSNNTCSLSLKAMYRDSLQGKITIPANIERNGTNYRVTSIGNSGFASTKITHVFFENSSLCESIGDKGFQNCSLLKYVELPNTITTLSNQAFDQCSVLEECIMGNDITTIANTVFSGCVKLKLTHLPSALQTIGISAFQGCSEITVSEIPNSVTSIMTYAFSGCSKIGITHFGVGDSKLAIIGAAAFNNAGKQVNEVFIGRNVETIVVGSGAQPKAFEKYGSDSGLIGVYFAKNIEDYYNSTAMTATHGSETTMGFTNVINGNIGTNIDM
jgi:hypothetical protein